MRERKLVASNRVRAFAGAAVAFVFAVPAFAAPTANDFIVQQDLAGNVDITFNIHDVGIVTGGPAPVYLSESAFKAVGTALPPGLQATRVGNACIRIQWSETTQDPFPDTFQVPFTLIAGDLSTSNQASISVKQGGLPIPSGTPCDSDPNNVAPQVTTNPIDVQTIAGTSAVITPVPPAGTAVTDIAGTVRLTDTACWVQPTNGIATRVSDTQISYVPNAGFTGPDSFEYCVTDNPLDNSTGPRGTVNVEVLPAGAPGVADDPGPNDPPLQTEIGVAFDIDVMANDPIGDAGTLFSVSTPVNGGGAAILANAACSFIPAAGQGCIQYTPPGPDPDGIVFVGTDSFNYVVSDAQGNTAQAIVTVNVVAAPGTPEPGIVAVSGVVAGVPTEIDVLAEATDDQGVQGLSISNISTPSNGTAVLTPRPDQTPVITYTSDIAFSGNDSFLYTISDGDPNTIDRVGRVNVNVVAPALLAALQPLARNATQAAVAGAIDVVCPALADLQASDPNNLLPPGQQELLTRCSALIGFAEDPANLSGVQSALQQIAGEEVFAQGTTGTRVVNTQIRNIGSRLAALRSGATGISAQGLAMNFDSGALPVGSMFARNGGGASADEDDPGNALLADSRLGIFINGRANFGDQDTTLDEDGFDFDTLGITLGADYRFRSNLVIGGAVGYADSEVEFNFDGGDLQTEALTYSLYATYFTEKIYFDILAGTGSSDYDTRRIMVFQDGTSGGVNTIALGTTDGDQSLLSMNLGYNFENKGWLFAPYISYDHLSTDVEAYNETEGQGWELAFDDQEVKSKVVTGGLRIAYNKTTSFGVFIPHVRVAFQKELEDDVRGVNVRFVNDPTNTNFEFLTAVPDTDFYRLGAGFSMVWANGLSGFIDYESIQGYDNLTSSTLTAGLRIERRFK